MTAIDSLAYASRIGVRANSPQNLIEKVKTGIPYSSFERLQRQLDLSANELANLVQISTRTLARRKKARRFQANESERLLRFSRLNSLAIGLFNDDTDAAKEWLKTPSRALDGEIPLAYAKSEIGAREVERLIGRLEHGIFP